MLFQRSGFYRKFKSEMTAFLLYFSDPTDFVYRIGCSDHEAAVDTMTVLESKQKSLGQRSRACTNTPPPCQPPEMSLIWLAVL